MLTLAQVIGMFCMLCCTCFRIFALSHCITVCFRGCFPSALALKVTLGVTICHRRKYHIPRTNFNLRCECWVYTDLVWQDFSACITNSVPLPVRLSEVSEAELYYMWDISNTSLNAIWVFSSSGFLLLCRINFPWLFPDFSRQNE